MIIKVNGHKNASVLDPYGMNDEIRTRTNVENKRASNLNCLAIQTKTNVTAKVTVDSGWKKKIAKYSFQITEKLRGSSLPFKKSVNKLKFD